MPSTSFAGGTVRVVVPTSYDARETPSGGRRSLPGEPGYATETSKAALLDSLRQGGFDQVQSIDLTPTRTRDLGGQPVADRTASNRTQTVSLDVDVAAADDAVVLLERDGVYSWHLPVNPADRTRGLDPKPRTARFEIDLRPAPSARPGRKPTAERQRSRGILGSSIHGAVQAIVLEFAVPYAVDKVIDKLEEHVRPGLLHLRGSDISTWEPFETLAELKLPTDRPVRILLFVHGTFSSTVGGFGAFAYDENASGMLRTAISAYDAVIGFDHKTLSVDPRANAKDLLARLCTHHPAHEFVIDIITHSRGGLTTRSFVEYELPQSTLAGQRRPHRLRCRHQWRYAPRGPLAVARPHRPLHQPRGRRGGRARGPARHRTDRGCRRRGHQGPRGARQVPRVLRRRAERHPGTRGDDAGRGLRQGDQPDPARTAGGRSRLARRLLELPRGALRRLAPPAGVPA